MTRALWSGSKSQSQLEFAFLFPANRPAVQAASPVAFIASDVAVKAAPEADEPSDWRHAGDLAGSIMARIQAQRARHSAVVASSANDRTRPPSRLAG
jgi:hypothetical protein